jgi:hypothetical protein
MTEQITRTRGGAGEAWPVLPADVRDALVALGKESCRSVYDGVALMETSYRPVRPPVLTKSGYAEITRVSRTVAGLIVASCRRRAATAGELREALGVPAGRVQLLDEDEPLTDRLVAAVRADVLLENGVPRLVECNIDSALGGVFDSDGIARRFLAAYADDPVLSAAGVAVPPSAIDARYEAMKADLGLADGAPVAMLFHLDSGYPGTDRPLEMMKLLEPFCARGRELGIGMSVHPLEWLDLDDAGRLRAGDRIVDGVMRMFIPRTLPDSSGLGALRAALRSGTVRMYLPAATWLLGNKAVFAWLWEDLGAMSAEDAEVVRRHVPRTEWVTGAAVDRAVEDQRRLVLKPSDDYGGHGVVIGPDVTAAEWREALRLALGAGGYVLQQHIAADPLTMQFLDLATEEVLTAEVPFCIATYLFAGRPAGAYTRFSPPGAGGVVNLHQGALTSGLLLVGDGEG